MLRDADIPSLVRRVRLRWDPVRATHVLLYPEGLLVLNESAAEVLARCDGRRSVGEIAASLQTEHPEAPPVALDADVREILTRLRDRGFVRLEAPT